MRILFFILFTLLIGGCQPQAENDEEDTAPVIASSDGGSSGGATETWGMILFERTYPPYFEQFPHTSSAKNYRLEFYSGSTPGTVEIGHVEFFSKQSNISDSSQNILLSSKALTTWIKQSYISAWDELQDSNYQTIAMENMTKYTPGVFDFELTNAANIEMIKISFHLTDITNELPEKMIFYKQVEGVGWVKIYQVSNLHDERFKDLSLDSLTTFKLTGGQICTPPLTLDNMANCSPTRVICSDLNGAFNNNSAVPCEIIYKNETIDCVAAASEANCSNSYPSNLCDEYAHFYKNETNKTLQVRAKLTNILSTVNCTSN